MQPASLFHERSISRSDPPSVINGHYIQEDCRGAPGIILPVGQVAKVRLRGEGHHIKISIIPITTLVHCFWHTNPVEGMGIIGIISTATLLSWQVANLKYPDLLTILSELSVCLTILPFHSSVFQRDYGDRHVVFRVTHKTLTSNAHSDGDT